MHPHTTLALALLLMPLCTTIVRADDAQPENDKTAQRYVIKQNQPSTGTLIPRAAVTSDLPLDKSYHQLTDAQRAAVRAQYETMAAGDEPPFPAEGLGKIYDILHKIGAKMHTGAGTLSVLVHIASTGEPTSAEVLNAPDVEYGNMAAQVAMLTKYKPAVCGGKPCAMDFIIRLERTIRH
jgi:hypothetical protein